MKHFALAVAVLLAATAASAEIYQWKDASGKTVISDKPPAGNVQTQKKYESGSPVSDIPTQKTMADRDLEFRKRQKESQDSAEKTRKEQATSADNKENCISARRYLQTLESGERVAMTDDKGERYYMEDAQRSQEITKARQAIQTNCK